MECCRLSILILLFVIGNGQKTTSERRQKWLGCLVPEPPLHGYLTFNEDRRTMTYHCNDGFMLLGMGFDRSRKCVNRRWLSREKGFCVLEHPNRCPRLEAPANGQIIQYGGEDLGDKVEFFCNQGYVLDGSTYRTCVAGRQWDGIQPVCQSRKSALDLALAMKETVIDKFRPQSNARLSATNGLDLVFVMDTSASIGHLSLERGKSFMKTLVTTFGVKPPEPDGNGGIQVALITFSENANVVFGLGDFETTEDVNGEIDAVETTGGGTDILGALSTMVSDVYLHSIYGTPRHSTASRAVFIITDAEITVEGVKDTTRLTQKADSIKELGFEIFTIGVGIGIHWGTLTQIASQPYAHHVFSVDNFEDLSRIGEIISEQNPDYHGCGISGDTLTSSGLARKGAWPWLGWLSTVIDGRPATCGGTLLCDRWFITAAHCVYNVTSQEPLDTEDVAVHLGDDQLYKIDLHDTTVRPARVLVHPGYNVTEPAQYGVRPYDVALLDFGENETSRPGLNKFIRPICAPTNSTSGMYNWAGTELSYQKANAKADMAGYVAGWGLTPDLAHRKPAVFPYEALRQTKRVLTGDEFCRRIFPNINTSQFFCVSSFPETETCQAGDMGGPYMVLLDKWVGMIGLALKTSHCASSSEDPKHTSIYLNTLEPAIVDWLGDHLDGCNRIHGCKFHATSGPEGCL